MRFYKNLKTPKSISLVIQFENGVNSTGSTIYKSLTLSNVNNSVSYQKVFIVTNTIVSAEELAIGYIYLKEINYLLEYNLYEEL